MFSLLSSKRKELHGFYLKDRLHGRYRAAFAFLNLNEKLVFKTNLVSTISNLFRLPGPYSQTLCVLHSLRMCRISKSIYPCQAFPALCNVYRKGQELTLLGST
jgi:hypothetical protein